MCPYYEKEQYTPKSFSPTTGDNKALECSATSYSAPLFREERTLNTLSLIPNKAIYSRNIDSMLKHRLGGKWQELSKFLAVSCDDIKSLNDKYLAIDDFEFQESEFYGEGEYYRAESNPNVINLIQELLSKFKIIDISLDQLIYALSQCDKYLAHCINIERKIISSSAEHTPKEFSSYIFTLWIKNPNRNFTNWGSFFPNTDILPHQQTVFDWAFLNQDKLVVLWYDSVNLTDSEKKDLLIYRDLVSPCLSNIRVLDIRNINFSNSLLRYEIPSPKGEYFVTPSEALHKEDSLVELQPHAEPSRLGLKVDFLRQRLLYEGSSAIESALTKDSQDSIPSSSIPCKGVWFDLDYIPVKFSSNLWSGADIFIDDSTRVLKPSICCYGTVTLSGMFMQSILAVKQDRLDILGSCLWVKSDDPAAPAHYYEALKKALSTFRHRVGGVVGFKMRTVPSYQGKFIQDTWVGPNSTTYSESYNPLIDSQSSVPLNTRKVEMPALERSVTPNTAT